MVFSQLGFAYQAGGQPWAKNRMSVLLGYGASGDDGIPSQNPNVVAHYRQRPRQDVKKTNSFFPSDADLLRNKWPEPICEKSIKNGCG